MNAEMPRDMAARIEVIADELDGGQSALLPILHAVQIEWGYIPDAALPLIANRLNLTRAEVYGVRTFYHDFRDQPPGERVVKLCRAEACQASGGRALANRALKTLGLEWYGTSPDRALTIEPVYCLGLCALAPAAMIDGKVYGHLDDERLARLIAVPL